MGRKHQLRELLRVGDGFDLAALDPASTPGGKGGKAAAAKELVHGAERLSELQERLYAEARGGGRRALLLVIQGLDTAGKGGIMRHVVGAVDPQGIDLTAFKQPTAEERAHPFLWRIRRALPRPGSDRRVRPVALRGRARRPGARARDATRLEAALRDDQPLRAATSSPTAPRS